MKKYLDFIYIKYIYYGKFNFFLRFLEGTVEEKTIREV